jgi:outer membrane protein, heavy metal efflux system
MKCSCAVATALASSLLFAGGVVTAGELRPESTEMGIAAADTTGPSTLEELLAEAEHSHPAILAARARAEADEQRPSQVGSYPDPTIGAAASNFRLDDPTLDSNPAAGVDLRFRQGIPFPGKLGRRRALAMSEADVSRKIAYEIASDVRTNVKSRYWELSGSESVEQITRENIAVLEELIDIANSRLSVGMGAQQDVLQVQAALAELKSQLLLREQETRSAQRGLNVAVGRPATAAPITASAVVLEATPIFDGESLEKAADLFNPRLNVRRAQVLAAENSLEEALHDRWPDFSVGGGYRIRQAIERGVSDGGDMVFLSLDMSIPLYASAKQNRRVDETRSRLVSARHTETDMRLQVGLLTQDLTDTSNRILDQAKLYRDEVIPQDRFALNAAVSDYSVGRVDFLSVLNNWQTLLRDEVALEQLTATLGVRLAELEFVVGRSLQ